MDKRCNSIAGHFSIFLSMLDRNTERKYNLLIKINFMVNSMKKAIRVILPIMLAFIIILCTVWYLFAYDREFTRDMLLSCARHFESSGDHSVAAWFYNKAYSHADDSDAVAIELANQYKKNGNYTKAEYTLSNAISDGGSVDLYIALSKIYLEQDKLLDAVTMLNNIRNPEIKSQIEKLRPAAPTVLQEPGFYTQYISVTFQTDEGALYVTADGQYPSLSDTPYAEPIQLVDGDNTLYALSVSENGLVSPLSVFGYTIGGVVEQINFTDSAFEAQIRSILGEGSNRPLYTNELWDILSFTMPAEATSFEDLRYLPYLQSLTISNGRAAALDIVYTLSSLTELSIANASISQKDLAQIAALPDLQKLTLSNCGISSISPLDRATKLTYLDLSNNTIRTLTAITYMKDLQHLNLQHNAVTSLTALADLKALTELNVANNVLTTLAPISELRNLAVLDASTNKLTELGNLGNLSQLKHLALGYNELTDVSVIAACTELQVLDISNNQLQNIETLSTLTQMLYFDFSYNQVEVLPVWPLESKLVSIDGSHNLLKSLDTLAGLVQLNNVYMDYNEEITEVNILASCPKLIQVNVYGTKVTEVEDLTYQSIIVNYNPVQDKED